MGRIDQGRNAAVGHAAHGIATGRCLGSRHAVHAELAIDDRTSSGRKCRADDRARAGSPGAENRVHFLAYVPAQRGVDLLVEAIDARGAEPRGAGGRGTRGIGRSTHARIGGDGDDARIAGDVVQLQRGRPSRADELRGRVGCAREIVSEDTDPDHSARNDINYMTGEVGAAVRYSP